jgi:hypothetical protein
MFKIMVDGKEHTRYDDACVRVDVGSAADAQVRLPSAAPEHLTIYPLKDSYGGSYGGCFKVTLHAPDGMTHKTFNFRKQTVQWTTDPPGWLVGTDINSLGREGNNPVFIRGHEPPGWVLVYGGDSMTVRGHVIQVINFCKTCGKEGNDLWQCTCAARRT